MFFWNFSKFNVDLKNTQEYWVQGFCFWDKCIWFGYVKLSLLLREHLSSTVNVCAFTRLPVDKSSKMGLFRDLSNNVFRSPLLVTCKILRLFVNILTASDKYSLLNRDNLTQPIQMCLSEKQKSFSEFFCGFFKSTLNLHWYVVR